METISTIKKSKPKILDFNLTNYYEHGSYVPGETSFIEYMLKLKEASNSKASNSLLQSECLANNHAFTVFNKIVYLYVCGDLQNKLANVCNFEWNVTEKTKQSTFGLLENLTVCNISVIEKKVGKESEIERSCKAFQDYITIRFLFKNLNESQLNVNQVGLHFFENIVEDMPFCQVFSCPYWIISNQSKTSFSSLYQCMPSSCRKGFWVILFIDLFLSVFIVIANSVIIVVTARTPCLWTPHG